MRVFLFGASGSIGRAALQALSEDGHEVCCPLRRADPEIGGVVLDLSDGAAVAQFLKGQPPFDAVLSCVASRNGSPVDAWAVDHDLNLRILNTAKEAGINRFVLLSAICVQQPELAFQNAKLAFEDKLRTSGLDWTIVRPTAFFKSLSGQIERVKAGKPFLVFGDGELTRCKPISDADLGRYLSRCLTDPDTSGRILPIGGPGPALSPLDQGRLLFRLLDKAPEFKRVPVAVMDAIIGTLSLAGRVIPKLKAKAELARIGRYYATHSMLVWDEDAKRYDADATPSFGTETLEDHYRAVLAGERKTNLGEHAVF